MEWVIGKLNAEVQELTHTAVRSMDEITQTTKKSMDDITRVAQQSMDNLQHNFSSRPSSKLPKL